MDFPDLPEPLLAPVRAACLALPETTEEQTQVGTQFKIRRRTFAHVFTVADPDGRAVTMLVCRADPAEREVLRSLGHPFFAPGTRVERIGVVLDGTTDWTEIAELVTESYRILAPKKLVALLDEEVSEHPTG